MQLAFAADAPPPTAGKGAAPAADRAQPTDRSVTALAPGHARVGGLFRELRQEFPELEPAACVRFYRTHGSARLEELNSLLTTDRPRARALARDLAQNFLRIQQAIEVSPAEHTRLVRIERLKNDSHVLARRIGQIHQPENAAADDRKRADARQRRLQKQLVDLLGTIFTANTQNQQVEINRLQAELDEMKRLLKQREASRELVIRGDYLELVGEPCPDEYLARDGNARGTTAAR